MQKEQFTISDADTSKLDEIRTVTLSAYAEYSTIMPPAFWQSYRQVLLAALEENTPAKLIVAVHDGVIVGSVMLYPPAVNTYASIATSTSWPELRLLAVLPQMRGQGIGTILVDECKQRARASGAKVLGLHTMEVMQTARRMYERMGFVRVPESDFRPAESVLVMGYQCKLDRV